MTALPLLLMAKSLTAETVDMKCYVALSDGSHVVLQQPVPHSSMANIVALFNTKGYEVDGVNRSVTAVIECAQLTEHFKRAAAQQQDIIQPR
jgi:hypothetical protein